MITKKCCGVNGHHACAEDYPDHILPIENFTEYYSLSTTGRCEVCVHYQNQTVGLNRKHNPKSNTISKIAYGYAGSPAKFYDLSKRERLYHRRHATFEYNNLVNGVPLEKSLGRKLPKVHRPKGRRVTIFKPDDPRGFVYVFRDKMKRSDGWLYYYKVGASHDPQERLNQANTWGDFESVYESKMVDDCVSLEKKVHQALSKYRWKGEWFQCDKYFIIKRIRELVDAREEQAMAEQKVS